MKARKCPKCGEPCYRHGERKQADRVVRRWRCTKCHHVFQRKVKDAKEVSK